MAKAGASRLDSIYSHHRINLWEITQFFSDLALARCSSQRCVGESADFFFSVRPIKYSKLVVII